MKFKVLVISKRLPAYTTLTDDSDVLVERSDNVYFFEKHSMSDFDIVIIDLDAVGASGHKYIKTSEFDYFFDKPSILVCIAREEEKWQFDSNYKWLPNYSNIDFKIVNKGGTSVIPTEHAGEFSKLFNSFEFEWECYFDIIPNEYIVIGKDRSGLAVALKTKYRNGIIYILPPPKDLPYSKINYVSFLNQLIEIGKKQIYDRYKELPPEPNWLQKYVDPLEQEYYEKLLDIKKKYDTLREAHKLLYFKHKYLSEIVFDVLCKMGFNAKYIEEEGYHDIEINEDDFTAVIEVTSSGNNWININKVRQILDFAKNLKMKEV